MFVKALLESKERTVVTCTPETSVDDAMELLIKNGIGCLPVVDEVGSLVGIVSDKDIFKKIHESNGHYHRLRVVDVMTTDPIVGLLNDDISYIAAVMNKNWIQHVPIVEGDKVVGIISLRDIIREMAETTEIENRYLNLYMDMMHRRDKSGD